jgi:hypothetical protein
MDWITMICERSKRTIVTIVATKVAHPLASGGDPNDGECFFVPECTQSSGGLMGTSRNSTNGTLLPHLLPLSSFRSELVELNTSGEKLAHILCDVKSIVTYSQQLLSNSFTKSQPTLAVPVFLKRF